MTITASLAPIPMWVILNNEGTAAGGAKLYTRRQRNKVEDKPVWKDPQRNQAWENPIQFNANGVQGPFYWDVNDADLTDTYFIFARDSDGNQLWSVENYFPPGSGGGGGDTTFQSIVNYVTNNQFIDHVADQANPLTSTNIVIAPSNHKGFTPSLVSQVVGRYGVLGSDIRFVKNNTVATDSITFETFALTDSPMEPTDVTPVTSIRYVCTNDPINETYKCFQFPITQKVKNLANQKMTFSVWAKCASGTSTIDIYTRQYFGAGTGSGDGVNSDFRDLQETFDLTTDWVQQRTEFTVPDLAGKSLGTPGTETDDDAFYLQLQVPLNDPCDVSFTKPCLYLGEIDPTISFESYDQIDSINSTARTGDIKTSLLSSSPQGWVAMNDGSIGNVGSGATNRANKDTFQLFSTIYMGVSDTFAPVSGGRTGSTMTTAIADFKAGKRLTLPKSLGRALAGAGTGAGLTARALGENLGGERITTAGMPAHTHPPMSPATSFVGTEGATGVGLTNLTSFPTSYAGVVTTGSTGGGSGGFGAADGNMQPTSFFNVFIKL